MKKISIIILCVFLALVFIGTAIFPSSDLQSTIDFVKSSFRPVVSAYGLASEAAEKVLSLYNVDIFTDDEMADAGITSGGIFKSLIECVEFSAPGTFKKMNILDQLSNPGAFDTNVTRTNLHDHKVCVIKITTENADGKKVNYQCLYCAKCNKVCCVYHAGWFGINMGTLYPLVESGAPVWGVVTKTYDFSEKYEIFIDQYWESSS